jgi:DNA invertase Pin-like site-specific DNA recombinase
MVEMPPIPAPLRTAKAYSYVRFSTPEQAQGDSLRRQTDKAVKYASTHGLELDTELKLTDAGVSGFRMRNAKTGALAAFLEAIQNNVVAPGSCLLVENIDRLTRADMPDAMALFLQIINAGIVVITLTNEQKYSRESFINEPWSIYAIVSELLRANMESVHKSTRVADAYEQKRQDAANGKLFTRMLPGWLLFNEDAQRIEVIPQRAEVVKTIFEKIDAGWSRQRIAQLLNEKTTGTWGIPNRKRKAQYWHSSYILKIISNPAVVGTFVPHKTAKEAGGRRQRRPQEPIEAYFPPVVERDLYERVTAHMKSTAARGRNAHRDPKSIFAGVIKCGHCGTTVTRVPKGDYVYLVCNKAHMRAGCRYQAARYQNVERRFCEVADWIVDSAPRGQDAGEIEAQINDLDAAVDELTDRARKGAALVIEEKSEGARLEMRAAEAELKEAVQRLTKLYAERERLTSETVRRKLETLRGALKRQPLDVVEANKALRQAVSKIVINPERGDLTIYWRHAEDNPSESIVFGGRHMKWD